MLGNMFACTVEIVCLLFLKQQVFVHVVDMSKPKDILKFCKEFSDSNSPLDVLVRRSVVWLAIIKSAISFGELNSF